MKANLKNIILELIIIVTIVVGIFIVTISLEEKPPTWKDATAVIANEEDGVLATGIVYEDRYLITVSHVLDQVNNDFSAFFPKGDNEFSYDNSYNTFPFLKERSDKSELTLLQSFPRFDVAVFYLENDPGVQSVTFSQNAEQGDEVRVYGAPMKQVGTLSQGIVSANKITTEGIPYIQTDAMIQPGSSGACLWNENNECVGIIVSGVAQRNLFRIQLVGLNHAVSTEIIKPIVEGTVEVHKILKGE